MFVLAVKQQKRRVVEKMTLFGVFLSVYWCYQKLQRSNIAHNPAHCARDRPPDGRHNDIAVEVAMFVLGSPAPAAFIRKIGYCLLPVLLGAGAALMLLLLAGGPARKAFADSPTFPAACGPPIQ